MQYWTTPLEVLTIFARANHKQVVGLNIKRHTIRNLQRSAFACILKIKTFPALILANFIMLSGKLLQTCCACHTFQRQRLPYSKLLEHDHKQSNHNNNGNYFHAIQFHDCLALDGTCTICPLQNNFRSSLFTLTITLYHSRQPSSSFSYFIFY